MFRSFLKFYVEHTESARAQICNRALHAPVIDTDRQQAARAWRTMRFPRRWRASRPVWLLVCSRVGPHHKSAPVSDSGWDHPAPLLIRKYCLLNIVTLSLGRHPEPSVPYLRITWTSILRVACPSGSASFHRYSYNIILCCSMPFHRVFYLKQIKDR